MKVVGTSTPGKLPWTALLSLSLALTLAASLSWAREAPAVDVTGGCGDRVLGRHLMLLEDAHRSMTIEDVSSPPLSSRFEPSDVDKPSFGLIDSAYWVRFTLVNRGAKPVQCILDVDYPTMDSVELFIPRPEGGYEIKKSGDQVPPEERTIVNRTPVFEVVARPKSAAVLTMRFTTEGVMQIPVSLKDTYAYLEADHHRQIALGIFCGLVLAMALYNLFLFYGIRDKAYLAYVSYILCNLVFTLSFQGMIHEYLFPDHPVAANRINTVSVLVTAISVNLFTVLFLRTKSQAPVVHKIIVFFTLFLSVNVFVASFGPMAFASKLTAISGSVDFIPLLFGSFYVWRVKKYAPAGFYLLAWTIFLLGSCVFGLRTLGVLPNTFLTAHTMMLGSSVEVVLLSLALAYRVKLFEKEKNDALAARVLEHERSEAKQRDATQAWQGTFDAIGSCVYLLDSRGLVLRANQAALDLLGRTKDDIFYEPLSALLKEASGSRSSSPPPGFGSASAPVENFIEFKDRWYSFRRDPICGSDDAVRGSVYVMTDVTDQKELEEQLFQAQKMEAIGSLAGGVAHDFNNLLSVIMSYAEFLLDSAEDQDTKDDAMEILKAARRAATLTGQLLAFSRKQVLKPALLHPNDIIQDLSKMLRRLIGENYRLSLKLTPQNGRIFFPKGQLEQILVNLVVNARDALPAAGEVGIETDWVEFQTPKQTTTGRLPAGKYLQMCVRDSGKGMDAATAARIFEPFFTTKGMGKGTGLGLAMVYGCAHQSEGAIDVLSAKGKGTRMTVYLPRADEHATKTSTPPLWDKTQGHGQRVLVVEDEPPVANAIRKILSTAGYHVLEASSAEDALELLGREPELIDILLTDIILSGMTGLELGAEVADRFPDTNILYMSGYGFEALTEQGIDPASIHLLAKPFTREEILGALKGR